MSVSEAQWVQLGTKAGLAAGGAAVAVTITEIANWSVWWSAAVLPLLALAQSWLSQRAARALARRRAIRRGGRPA